jgi:cytochrome c oxidase subunit 3
LLEASTTAAAEAAASRAPREPSTPAHAVAHQFDDAEQQYDAATLGMWVFLVTEVLFFGGMFTLYVVYRSMFPAAFAAGSHELDFALGTINTAVLITSSLTMVLAVHAAQAGGRAAQMTWLIATMALGAVFLGIKFTEYAHKFAEHLVPGPSFRFAGPEAPQAELFFSLYFVLTGFHALHMVIGLGLLSVLTVLAWRGRFGPGYFTPVEVSGLYWHFVDLIWIFLYPLLYLIDRHH